MKHLFTLSALLLGLGACTSPEHARLASQVPNSSSSLAPLSSAATPNPEQGKILYAESCSGCHGLIAPSALNHGEWDLALAKMQKRAGLSDQELEILRQYLHSMSKP